jgi:hypothetical protein
MEDHMYELGIDTWSDDVRLLRPPHLWSVVDPMRTGFYLFDTDAARTVLAGPFDDWQAACDAVDKILATPGRDRGVETAYVNGEDPEVVVHRW